MKAYLSKWLWAIWLLLLGSVYSQAIESPTFAYDGQVTATFAYGAGANLSLEHDGKPVFCENNMSRRLVSPHTLFGEFDEFLAAEEEMVTVTHFTDAATVGQIQAGTGTLNAGSFVTLPSEVAGMNASQVEAALEINAGKGAFSSTFQTPAANLGPAFNGPLTSRQKIQFQLINPTTSGPFIPTQ